MAKRMGRPKVEQPQRQPIKFLVNDTVRAELEAIRKAQGRPNLGDTARWIVTRYLEQKTEADAGSARRLHGGAGAATPTTTKSNGAAL